MQAYVYVFSSIILGAVGQVLMKLGTTMLTEQEADTLVRKLLTLFLQPYVVGGLLCYGVSAVLWILALTRLQLSHAYPMVALGYVIVFILSVVLFKEAVTLHKLGGLILIVSGVLVLAR
jgi:multidrug transporter EmrE-like cation transporter